MANTDTDAGALKGISVLLVDDDADCREIYGTVLRYEGALVIEAQSKAEALDRLRGGLVPDVIVSDIAMPGGDGLSFIQTVRQFPTRLATVPAIAITAFDEDNPKVRTLAAGFHRQFRKPVSPTVLCKAIVELVGRRHTDGASAGNVYRLQP